MTTLAELIKQKEALDYQIANAKKAEKADAISKVKAMVTENGLTEKDIFRKTKKNIKFKITKGN
jgi:DNA-binding protein H-NS